MADDAKAIYQANLDAVTRAIWAADLALALEHISMPHRMMTADSELVITSPDALCLVMADLLERLHSLGADSYQRLCLEARFLTGSTSMIRGRHRTRILRQDAPLGPGYVSDMVLMRGVDGAWRTISIEAAASEKDHPLISQDLAEGQRRALQRLSDRPTIPPEPED